MKIANAITVDLEDYFHSDFASSVVPRSCWDLMPSRVEANTDCLLDMFARHDVKATFFILGWVAERHPDLVALIHELGHELGCHGYWHRPVDRMSQMQFREDTYRARSVIEDVAGAPVYGYRAPESSMSDDMDWVFDVLAELGFTYDASVVPVERRRYPKPDASRFPYRVARGALLEIPESTTVVGQTLLPVGSGTCLRIMPLSYVRSGIQRVNEEGFPAILRVEPADFDPKQPRLHIPLLQRLRKYSGLSRSQARLEVLLTEFPFAPIGRAFDTHFASLDALAV